ncbi:MAG TPA: ABC transporter ATP-binding protein, partial [Chromatiales bacterium]|nr:ABC transporter ATP-binding protein [Chromatiales bacterium]
MTATVATNTQPDAAVQEPARKGDLGPVLKRIFEYMVGQGDVGRFLLASFLRLLAVIGIIAVPYFSGNAVNAIADHDGDALQTALTIMFVILVLYTVLSALSERILARMATTAVYRLQKHLFSHLQTLSLSFFDRQPVGELMSRVSNDTEA